MGCQQYSQMVTSMPLEGHCIDSLVFFFFFPYIHSLCMADETRICFWEDLWWEDQPMSSQLEISQFQLSLTMPHIFLVNLIFITTSLQPHWLGKWGSWKTQDLSYMYTLVSICPRSRVFIKSRHCFGLTINLWVTSSRK